MKKAKVLKSFTDLGKVWGVAPKQKNEPKSRKCFRCGGDMHNIEGTNVFVCTGTTKAKDGKERQCPNRLIVNTKAG